MTKRQHRLLNSAALIIIATVGLLYSVRVETRLEVCSDLLYEELTGQAAPKVIHK